MKKIRKFVAMLLTLAMCLSLAASASAKGIAAPTMNLGDNINLEIKSGPYMAPRAGGYTYFYNGREECNDYTCSFPCDCSRGTGTKLDVHVDNSIGDVMLEVMIYYDNGSAGPFLVYPERAETFTLSDNDGRYLTGSGRVVVTPSSMGDSVYWMTICLHS